jgi:hypothetical protein
MSKTGDTTRNGMRRLLRRSRLAAIVAFVLVALSVLITSRDFLSMHTDPPIYPGSGVTAVVKLSAYFSALSGTAADTDVYILEGPEPGGTVLVLGGTHPNEPASSLTAVTLI